MAKEVGNEVLEKFETKLKEMRVKGHRRGVPSFMYAEDNHEHLHETYYRKSELEDIDTKYMGTEKEEVSETGLLQWTVF